MADAAPRRQHTVSQVILRRFTVRTADPSKRNRIAVFDSQTGRINDRSPKSVFLIEDFVTHEPVEIENRWGQVETQLPSALDALAEGRWPLAADTEDVIRAAVALHWIRSAGTFLVHNRIAADQVAKSKARTATWGIPVWTQAYYNRTGLHVSGSKGARLAQDRIYGELAPAAVAEIFAEKLVEYFHATWSMLKKYRVQVGFDPTGSLFIGDSPVITPDPSTGGLAMHHGVAVMDAKSAVMPVSPGLVVSFDRDPLRTRLNSNQIRQLNQWQQSCFLRWIACSVRSPFRGSLGRPQVVI